MKKDLSEFLYSKLNCSFKTAYEILDMSYEEEKTRRKKEKNDGIDDIFTPHATSFNSSGDINSNGRPSGTINAADANTNKIDTIYYDILKIIRSQK